MNQNEQIEQSLRQQARFCVRNLCQKMCMLKAVEENFTMPNREQKLETYRRKIEHLESKLANILALRDWYLLQLGRPIYDTSEI